MIRKIIFRNEISNWLPSFIDQHPEKTWIQNNYFICVFQNFLSNLNTFLISEFSGNSPKTKNLTREFSINVIPASPEIKNCWPRIFSWLLTPEKRGKIWGRGVKRKKTNNTYSKAALNIILKICLIWLLSKIRHKWNTSNSKQMY